MHTENRETIATNKLLVAFAVEFHTICSNLEWCEHQKVWDVTRIELIYWFPVIVMYWTVVFLFRKTTNKGIMFVFCWFANNADFIFN